jgi:dCTP deaminase
MVLIDRELRALIKQKALGLEPFDDGLVQSSSIDIRLDSFARVIRSGAEELDIRTHEIAQQYEDVAIGEAGHVIPARGVLIGQTMERIRIPSRCVGAIAQRSSFLRLGISVSSSLINPGYEGNLPCLIANLNDRPVRVFAGVPICQLVLFALIGRPDMLYPDKKDAKYNQEREFLVSAIAKDADRWLRPGPRLAHPEQADDFKMEVSEAAEEPDDKVR